MLSMRQPFVVCHGRKEFLFRDPRLSDEFTRRGFMTEPRNFHFLIPKLNMSFMGIISHPA
jgi:hypothetical protein